MAVTREKVTLHAGAESQGIDKNEVKKPANVMTIDFIGFNLTKFSEADPVIGCYAYVNFSQPDERTGWHYHEFNHADNINSDPDHTDINKQDRVYYISDIVELLNSSVQPCDWPKSKAPSFRRGKKNG